MSSTQVDFYLLSANSHDPLMVACRIAEKAWKSGLTVHVATRDEAMSSQLDDMLWTFRQESFVPHERMDDSAGAEPLDHTGIVSIGCGRLDRPVVQMLINLSEQVPEGKLPWTRVAEVVGADEQSRSLARERYRRYREARCELNTHDV